MTDLSVFEPDPALLVGQREQDLVEVQPGQRLLPEAAEAFLRLQAAAAAEGFDLRIASAFRSYERQQAIWDGKLAGQRPVHDDAGAPVDLVSLSEEAQLHAILRFSALPGASRHHWGTDFDVYDAAALPADQSVELVPAEVAPGGIFDPLHCWLDERMVTGRSEGFYRPYAADRGGVAPERWHLSYAPLAEVCAREHSMAAVKAAWDIAPPAGHSLLLQHLEALFARYVEVPLDWCPPRF